MESVRSNQNACEVVAMKSSSVQCSRFGHRAALGALLGLMVAFAVPGEAPASAGEPEKSTDRASCADSYRNAQMQRRSGALRRARESLIMCSSDRCPAVLQPDCMRWLTEVEAAMPTMTVAAKGVDGKDVTDVRVSLDGQLFSAALDGKSVSIDPGSHTLHFEHGTEAPIDQQIVVREGEKSRVVSVSWAKAPVEINADHFAAPPRSSPSTAAWVFGGIGAASLATFGVLALHGLSRRSDLQKECFGSCDQSRIDSIKTEFAIGDAALGVGIVSIGIAAVLFLSGGSVEKQSPSPVTVGVAPRKDGAALGLSGSF
jgi:hypothetical protein